MFVLKNKKNLMFVLKNKKNLNLFSSLRNQILEMKIKNLLNLFRSHKILKKGNLNHKIKKIKIMNFSNPQDTLNTLMIRLKKINLNV